MKTLEQIKEDFHRYLLDVRSVEIIVNSNDFEYAYSRAPEDAKSEVEILLGRVDRPAIVDWIRSNSRDTLSCKPIKELRVIARRLRLRNWCRKDKSTLLSEIFNYEQREAEANSQAAQRDAVPCS